MAAPIYSLSALTADGWTVVATRSRREPAEALFEDALAKGNVADVPVNYAAVRLTSPAGKTVRYDWTRGDVLLTDAMCIELALAAGRTEDAEEARRLIAEQVEAVDETAAPRRRRAVATSDEAAITCRVCTTEKPAGKFPTKTVAGARTRETRCRDCRDASRSSSKAVAA